MRFDESRVREYNMNRFEGDLYPENYSFKYPKAGEQNSIVEVYNYNLESGRRSRIDTGKETDQYIPRVKWTPAGGFLVYRLNRPQNHFELLLCDAAALAAGAGTDAGVVPARVIYEERGSAVCRGGLMTSALHSFPMGSGSWCARKRRVYASLFI